MEFLCGVFAYQGDEAALFAGSGTRLNDATLGCFIEGLESLREEFQSIGSFSDSDKTPDLSHGIVHHALAAQVENILARSIADGLLGVLRNRHGEHCSRKPAMAQLRRKRVLCGIIEP